MGHKDHRRDSSSSSSSSDSGFHKVKKDKKHKKEEKHKSHSPVESHHSPQSASGSHHFIPTATDMTAGTPPPYSSNVPPQGRRFQTTSTSPFPAENVVGPPPFRDLDGSAVYVGSAVMDNSVHPCKLVARFDPPARVAYGGGELEHRGRYDVLPITPDMEWVTVSPHSSRSLEVIINQSGRRTIDGGIEENGSRLFHALAVIDGVSVPGKTGLHLGGYAEFAYGGGTRYVDDNYWILCWK